MSGLPFAVPPNYIIRLVEEPLTSPESQHDDHPVQPHPSHPSHFQFPRSSLHAATLHSHFNGPHTPGSIRAPKSATAWSPATDIRETMAAYHIEVEVPGVRDEDKGKLMIQWLSPHTLLVQGVAERPASIGLNDGGQGKRVWEGKDGEGWAKEAGHGKLPIPDGGPLVRTPSRETVEAELLADTTPTILLSERKLGPWRRTFTLPEDVEMRELKARLEAGILRIDLPKRSLEEMADGRAGGVRIEIE